MLYTEIDLIFPVDSSTAAMASTDCELGAESWELR